MRTVHQGVYRNLLGESIELRILTTVGYQHHPQHHHHQGSVQHNPAETMLISIRRDRRRLLRRYLKPFALYTLLVVSLALYFTSNWIRSHLLISIVLYIGSLVVLFYLSQPTATESIILLWALGGIQYTRTPLWGSSITTFINTNRLLINEAITMQQVIFYLVAIPPRLEPLVLDQASSTPLSPMGRPRLSTQSSVYDLSGLHRHESIEDSARPPDHHHADHHRLIPLFLATLPRLDCLRVIYRHLSAFNRTPTTPSASGSSFSPIKTPEPSFSLHHRLTKSPTSLANGTTHFGL